MRRTTMIVCMVVCSVLWSGVVCAEEGPPTGNRTLVVALDGSGDFKSIQEAVDAAKKGDTVFLKEGRYEQDI
ncbi:MAG TPA: hypothetical protein VKB81_17340, partial [Nitrospira sp.]|nr:hypothetical protein [Nitrospira sp.]